MLLIIILAMIAGVGYYVWHVQKQTSATLDAASKVAQSSPSKPKSKGQNTTYHDKVGRFTVTYPGTATLNFPKKYNSTTSTMVNIHFADNAVLTLTSNLGGRGIELDCTYDESTGKTTWTEDTITGRCPYLVISSAQKLSSVGNDRNQSQKNVYLVDNNYIDFDQQGNATTLRRSCLVLGLDTAVGKKVYGPTFVDPELTTYKADKSTDRFVHACTSAVNDSDPSYFNLPSTKEAKAVLASFTFDN